MSAIAQSPARPAAPPLPLVLLALAPLLGLLFEPLLRPHPLGPGLPLAVLLLLGSALLAGRVGEIAWEGEGRWLAPLPLLLALAVPLRDSPFLLFALVVSLAGSFALLAARARRGRLLELGLVELVFEKLAAGVETLLGPTLIAFVDVRWGALPLGRWSRALLALAKGAALAVPALLVFGALFRSADARFDGIVRDLVALLSEELLVRLALASLLGWFAAGFLRRTLLGSAAPSPRTAGLRRAGFAEIATALVLVAALFALFVALQLPYFFGDAGWLRAEAGLTCAEWARRGFFELLAVAALALPMLLLAESVVRLESDRERRLFRVVAALQLLLVLAVVASALHRMQIYVAAYGLTLLRLWSTVAMVWLAAVLGAFGLTVLRGRRERFIGPVAVSALLVPLLLAAANPDAIVARTNLDRARGGAAADVVYLTRELSADAVPTILARLSGLPEGVRLSLSAELRSRWGGAEPESDRGWRAWNRARTRARRLVVSQLGRLGETSQIGS